MSKQRVFIKKTQVKFKLAVLDLTLKLFHVVDSGYDDLLLFIVLWSPVYHQLVQLHGDDVVVI